MGSKKVSTELGGCWNSSAAGKESACNAGDPGSIPVSGRSAGEGTSCYPLSHSWAFLVAQLVKNRPATWGTRVKSLGWEDPLEKGTATHSGVLAWKIRWTAQPIGLQRVGHDWATFTSLHFKITQRPIHQVKDVDLDPRKERKPLEGRLLQVSDTTDSHLCEEISFT